MRTILRIPIRTDRNRESICELVSPDLFTLETGCSVGSRQHEVRVNGKWHINFTVKNLDENDHESVRTVYPDPTTVTLKASGYSNVPAWSWLNRHVVIEFIKDLLRSGWTNPDNVLEEYQPTEPPKKQPTGTGVKTDEGDGFTH